MLQCASFKDFKDFIIIKTHCTCKGTKLTLLGSQCNKIYKQNKNNKKILKIPDNNNKYYK